MAGDHACPVCGSRFTRPQHVTRHMRSHTGDRPYRCTTCGDQFARSDLLSRHVNKCHSGTPAAAALRANKRNTHHTTTSNTSNQAAVANNALTDNAPCDPCIQARQQCDLGNPCGKCILRKAACTYSTKATRTASGSTRRVSLPSIQQPPNFLYGAQAQSGQPYGLPSGQFGLGQYAGDYGAPVSTTLPSLTAAQPVPMPNGQYIGEDSYGLFGGQSDQQYRLANGTNVLPQPGNPQGGYGLPRLGSLSYATGQPGQGQPFLASSKPPPVSQPYVFNDNGHNTLPPLAALGTDPAGLDGSQDSTAAAYLQDRRGSLNLGHSRGYSAGSDNYQFNVPSSASSGSADHRYHRQSYPGAYNPQGSPASLMNRHFDGARINDRLRGFSSNASTNDDASSVSDFGSNSGAPSPVPSAPSAFSSSSRPTSSAGSLGPSGLETQQSQGDNYASSLQGAIPLPTPLQMGSFNAFGGAPGANDRTPGASAEAAPASGKTVFPPYQSFEHMNLDEAASFAAAAKNAGYPNNSTNAAGNAWSSQYNAAFGPPTLSQQAILSAGGRDRAIAELKDFWSAFISEPLTGGGNGASTHNSGGSNSSNGNGHSLNKQLSLPSLKTPMSSERTSILDLNHPTPRALYPSGTHSSILGMFTKGGDANATKENKADPPPKAASVQPPPAITSAEDEENLRSYQEACLKRETPMLRLQPRPKSRTISSSVSPQNMSSGVPLPGTRDVEMKSQNAFAAPFAPGSKEARNWGQYRAQAAAATDLHQSTSTARSMSNASTDSGASRPSYKRLPSQTLGPENSKRTRESAVDDDEEAASGGSDDGYHVSYPHPGYAAGGAAHSAWMRQRSMSSPTGTRPNFDWQALGAGRN